MENKKLLEIIELLKQKIFQERNNYESQINNLLNVINNQKKEIQIYKYKLSELNNNFNDFNNYIDKIEHRCIAQDYEVQRLEKEKQMKDILNKKNKRKTATNKKKINENKGFSIDKKIVSFD